MPFRYSHVFISYCRENFTEVTRLRADLMRLGEHVWWDQDIKPGQDRRLAIRQAMKESYAVVWCLSEECLKGKVSGIYAEVLDAITAYRDYSPGSIFLIPVRLSDCEIPSIEIDSTRTLDRLHHVDLFPASNWDTGIKKLVEAIQLSLHHPPPSSNLKTVKPQGTYLHTMCDRSHHILQFIKFFRTNLLRRSGLPQIYLLYGEVGQSHDNFITRLLVDKIKPYAASITGELEGTVDHIPAHIDPVNDLEDAKDDLRFSIFENAKLRYNPERMLASELCNHHKFKLFPFVVLQHNFEVADWNQGLRELIEWYLTAYWVEAESGGFPSQFLIFLNFIYPNGEQASWSRFFRQQKFSKSNFNEFLSKIQGKVEELYPCLLFDELGYPNQKDVCRTLGDLGMHDEVECPEWLKELFRKKRGKVKMSEVERLLKARLNIGAAAY